MVERLYSVFWLIFMVIIKQKLTSTKSKSVI